MTLVVSKLIKTIIIGQNEEPRKLCGVVKEWWRVSRDHI